MFCHFSSLLDCATRLSALVVGHFIERLKAPFTFDKASKSTPSRFVHQPLDKAGGREIRLLSRDSSLRLPTDLLCFKLRHYNLQDHDLPHYCALSYAWGTYSKSCSILINGCICDIRPNLHRFLQEFSISTEEFIWIDQLSINQVNVSERNQQVSIMSMISGQASKVLVWLDVEPLSSEDLEFREPCDPPEPSIGIAMQFFKDDTRRTRIADIWNSRFEPSSPLNTFQVPFEVLISNQYVQWSLRLYFLASYWTRLWIVQEILLARDIEIWCSSERLRWADLQLFCELDTELLYALNLPKVGLDTIRSFVESRKKNSLLPFQDCVSQYLAHHCTDPRDKIYGLQALVVEEERMKVDYTLTTEEVFVTAALHLARARSPQDAMVAFLGHEMGLDNKHDILKIALATDILSFAWNDQARLMAIAWLHFMLEDTIFGPDTAYDLWCTAERDGSLSSLPRDLWDCLLEHYEIERARVAGASCSIETWSRWADRIRITKPLQKD